MDTAATEKHPRGLYVLFGSEMWERYSFYTVNAMLALYLRDTRAGLRLHERRRRRASVVGTCMFVYFTPLLGGLIADLLPRLPQGDHHRRRVLHRRPCAAGGAGQPHDRATRAGLPRHRQRLLQAERLLDGRQPLSRGQPSQGQGVPDLLHGHQRRRGAGADRRRLHPAEVGIPSGVLHGRDRHDHLADRLRRRTRSTCATPTASAARATSRAPMARRAIRTRSPSTEDLPPMQRRSADHGRRCRSGSGSWR